MRKKPQLILIVFALLTHSITAQDYSIGLKGGANYNNIGEFYSIGGSIATGTPNETFTANNEIGYQFGLFFKVDYSGFFIQPEVNYVTLKNSYDFPTKIAEWNAKQIDVPLLVGYRVYNPVSIYAGPVFSFISETTMDGWEEDSSYADPFTYNESSTSICAGILVDFGKVGIDFRYQYGITKVEEQRLDMIKTYNGYGVNLGDLLEYNPSQISIAIHFKFFNSDSAGKRTRSSGSGWRNHKNL